MAAVQIEHIRLEAGDLQTDAVVLPLLSQTLLVGLVLDLVCAVACLLQQLVGIADDIVAPQVCAVDDLLSLLVCFTDHVFAHALGVDQCALEHIAVSFKALQLALELLVLCGQISDLLAQLLCLRIVLLQLLLDLVQKTIHVLCTVAAEVFFKLYRADILRGQHSHFLP